MGMRRILFLGLLSLSFLLTACGGSSSDPETQAPSNSSSGGSSSTSSSSSSGGMLEAPVETSTLRLPSKMEVVTNEN